MHCHGQEGQTLQHMLVCHYASQLENRTGATCLFNKAGHKRHGMGSGLGEGFLCRMASALTDCWAVRHTASLQARCRSSVPGAAKALLPGLTWREELKAEECLAILDVLVDLVNDLHLELLLAAAKLEDSNAQLRLWRASRLETMQTSVVVMSAESQTLVGSVVQSEWGQQQHPAAVSQKWTFDC